MSTSSLPIFSTGCPWFRTGWPWFRTGCASLLLLTSSSGGMTTTFSLVVTRFGFPVNRPFFGLFSLLFALSQTSCFLDLTGFLDANNLKGFRKCFGMSDSPSQICIFWFRQSIKRSRKRWRKLKQLRLLMYR